MDWINLTPHEIVVRCPDGRERKFPPSGSVARVSELPSQSGREVDGIPVDPRPLFGEVVDLPDPREGVVCIVSGMVAGHVSRGDVVAPGTGPKDGAVRDDSGRIVAVTRFKGTV